MMKKKIISCYLLCTLANVLDIVITRNWGGRSTTSKGMQNQITENTLAWSYIILEVKKNFSDFRLNISDLPFAIELISHVGPSHFTKNGIYKLEDAHIPTYNNQQGCIITKIQGMESCVLENCKEKCFGKDSSGVCFEVLIFFNFGPNYK